MKKMICKMCKKEYFVKEGRERTDSGFCSIQCEMKSNLQSCARSAADRPSKGRIPSPSADVAAVRLPRV